MFYKGVLQSYDQAFEAGKILLTDSNEVIDFSIRDLPNSALEPRIGERIKCVVDKSNDFSCAKFIVRLDKKNAKEEANHNKDHNEVSSLVVPEYLASLEKKIAELKNQLAEHCFQHQADIYHEIELKQPNDLDVTTELNAVQHDLTTELNDSQHDFDHHQEHFLSLNDNENNWFKKLSVILNYKIYNPKKKIKAVKVAKINKVKRSNQVSYIVPLSLIIVIMSGLMVHFGGIAYTQYQMHNLNQELKVQEYIKEQKLIIEEQKRVASQ